jgi:prophage regulatory protein
MTQLNPPTSNRIIRKPELLAKVGLSNTTIWRLVRARRFPAPIRLSPNSVGWIDSEIEHWIIQRAEEPGR